MHDCNDDVRDVSLEAIANKASHYVSGDRWVAASVSRTGQCRQEWTQKEHLQYFVRHVVLSGGPTIFQGIVEHVTALAPSTMINVGALVREFPDTTIISVAPKTSCCVKVFSSLTRL